MFNRYYFKKQRSIYYSITNYKKDKHMKYIPLKHVYPKDKRGVSTLSKSNAIENDTVGIHPFYVCIPTSQLLSRKKLSPIIDFILPILTYPINISITLYRPKIYLHIIPNITEQNIRATNPVK